MDSDYSRFHQNPLNLAIHLLAVPVFILSPLLFAGALLGGAGFAGAALWLAGLPLSLVAQLIGHKLEAVPPRPFDGPRDLVGRIVSEQLFRFWAHLLSGRAFDRGRSA